MADVPERVPRRDWLFHGLYSSVAVCLGAIFYPVIRFLWPRAATVSGAPEVIAPYRVDQLKLDADGHWPSAFDFRGKPCLLVLTDDGEVKAFNGVCTHVDCTVEYRPEKGDIFCNCHNGVYDINGRNVSGPPPRPLEAYKVTLRGEPGKEEIIVSRST